MKSILVLVTILSLTACEKYSEQIDNKFSLPQGLQDCQLFELHNDAGGRIIMGRCPNSTTSVDYQCGKTRCESLTTSY